MARFGLRKPTPGAPPNGQPQVWPAGTIVVDSAANKVLASDVVWPAMAQGSKNASPKDAAAQTLQLAARAADIDQYTLQWTRSGLAVPSGLSAAISADWDVEIS
jgi:hypothetical protein